MSDTRTYKFGVYWDYPWEIPDLGTLEYIGTSDGHRQYRAESADFDKLDLLPKDQLCGGDGCLFLDTSEYAEFLATTGAWYKL